MNKKITIVHIIKDDKFFKGTSFLYDQLSEADNHYYFYVKSKNYQFKYIKDTQKVKVFTNYINYVKAVRNKNVDIVLFHSLLPLDIILLNLVSSRQKIIWWAWGYDIYDSIRTMPPLIKLELYKPLTKSYITRNTAKFSLNNLPNVLIGKLLNIIRYFGVQRVDYFIPCMPLDYKILKEQCTFFRAKEFPYGLNKRDFIFEYKKNVGNILIGNSCSYTNNHLDIFEKIQTLTLPHNTKCIVPINYGTDYCHGKDLKSSSTFSPKDIIWLEDFLNYTDYYSLISSVSHAVFGVIRQQALGNIYYCLRTGVKVYLYRDSLVAKQLEEWGFVFFTIDNDLTEESLASPLSKEDAYNNYNVYNKIRQGRSAEDVQDFISKMFN